MQNNVLTQFYECDSLKNKRKRFLNNIPRKLLLNHNTICQLIPCCHFQRDFFWGSLSKIYFSGIFISLSMFWKKFSICNIMMSSFDTDSSKCYMFLAKVFEKFKFYEKTVSVNIIFSCSHIFWATKYGLLLVEFI